jgi:hypothetical protein
VLRVAKPEVAVPALPLDQEQAAAAEPSEVFARRGGDPRCTGQLGRRAGSAVGEREQDGGPGGDREREAVRATGASGRGCDAVIVVIKED